MAVILGSAVINERIVRRALVTIVLLGLVAGLLAYTRGDSPLAHWIWGASTVPVVVALAVSIARDLFRGRMGVDGIAFLSMIAALVLGQTLAGIVVAIMYAGGTVLEDFAVARAERSLNSWWTALQGSRIGVPTNPLKTSRWMTSRLATPSWFVQER